jgi:hypothetical protein
MNPLSPRLREILEAWHPGREPIVEKETEWMYHYKLGSKSGYKIPKFWDEDFRVSPSTIRLRWPLMKEDERLEFCSCWSLKSSWSAGDAEILEIVMRDGNDHLWTNCSFAFTKHTDRDRAVSFLIERLENLAPEDKPLNYFQALGIMKDGRAAAAIRPYYEKYRAAVQAESVIGVPEDVVFGPIPYFPYLCACGALVQVDGAPEYEQEIRKYFEHSNEQVRWWAEHALGIEGPTTAKRNAEHRQERGPSDH